jgi:hypothetical protein
VEAEPEQDARGAQRHRVRKRERCLYNVGKVQNRTFDIISGSAQVRQKTEQGAGPGNLFLDTEPGNAQYVSCARNCR